MTYFKVSWVVADLAFKLAGRQLLHSELGGADLAFKLAGCQLLHSELGSG